MIQIFLGIIGMLLWFADGIIFGYILGKTIKIGNRTYFQSLHNILIQFIEQRKKTIENVKQILFSEKENYLEIIFFVDEPNIKITQKISELTYDLRKDFPQVDLDFMVLDEKEFEDEVKAMRAIVSEYKIQRNFRKSKEKEMENNG